MAPKTRITVTAGARSAPPEGRTSRAPDAPTTAAYRRAAGQRCWACNAPDSEPVRLQRQAGEEWVTDATVQLCTACLTALRTPRLVRQLGLGRARAAPPASPAPAEAAPEESPSRWGGAARRATAADAARGGLTPCRLLSAEGQAGVTGIRPAPSRRSPTSVPEVPLWAEPEGHFGYAPAAGVSEWMAAVEGREKNVPLRRAKCPGRTPAQTSRTRRALWAQFGPHSSPRGHRAGVGSGARPSSSPLVSPDGRADPADERRDHRRDDHQSAPRRAPGPPRCRPARSRCVGRIGPPARSSHPREDRRRPTVLPCRPPARRRAASA